MKVNVIYNGREEIGTLIEKGNKHWLIRIEGIGDRKIAIKDILEAELSWDEFRERNYR